MRRREFITLVGGAVAAWPLPARAQQAAMPVVGFLSGSSEPTEQRHIAGFRLGLKEIGFIEDTNVKVEYRFANDDYAQLPGLAADLLRQHVAVIVTGTPPAARSAKAATSTIPIVFVVGPDPIKLGLVAALNRPGGNLTGFSFLANDLEAKRLGLLHDLVSDASTVGILVNPSNAATEGQLRTLNQAASALKLTLDVATAKQDSDFEPAFESFTQHKVAAAIVGTDAFFYSRRAKLVALSAHYSLPTIYSEREFADTGGLVSYGANIEEAFHQAGVYAGKVLKGAKPDDLPVLQADKFELVINVKTAKALGLAIPSGVLAIADEVIE
jgi:putative tryptophan/tyrosine transport system substrate-binding protein